MHCLRLPKRVLRFIVNQLIPPLAGIPYKYRWKVFFWQRILRINGHVPWPVHPTSRVANAKQIRIGKRTYPGLSAHQYVQGINGIVFGDNVRIGPGVGIISANHSLEDYDQHVSVSPIQIWDHCWIGMNAIILPGVVLGAHVIVGAGSVVTHSFSANVVISGNPARVVKRIDDEVANFNWNGEEGGMDR